MIGVFVTFRYGDKFDEQAVRKIAETARVRFEGMPELHSKAFTVNSGRREATNFYVWDSEGADRATRSSRCSIPRSWAHDRDRSDWAVVPRRLPRLSASEKSRSGA